jgi:hypothetical protein
MEHQVLSKITIAVVSDLHCGSTVGLHPDTPTPLDDGGSYNPSKAQLWLHDVWVNYWKSARAAAEGGEFHIITAGDLVDGDHHNTTQIVSRHGDAQMNILQTCFAPILAEGKIDSFTVVRGTEVHVGKSGSAENTFARWVAGQGVNVTREAGTGNHSHWHFRGQYGGKMIDVAHHGRIGSRPWTKNNATLGLAAQIVMEYANQGQLAPELAIRGHYHQWVDTGDAFRTRVIQMPAFQLATAYVHRVAPGALADIGGAVIQIENGVLNVGKYLVQPERPPVQVIA